MKRLRKGFTLVELLIVIAIVGALGVSMSLAAKDSTPKAQVAALISDFKILRTAAVMYNIDSSDKGATLEYFNNHSNDYLQPTNTLFPGLTIPDFSLTLPPCSASSTRAEIPRIHF